MSGHQWSSDRTVGSEGTRTSRRSRQKDGAMTAGPERAVHRRRPSTSTTRRCATAPSRRACAVGGRQAGDRAAPGRARRRVHRGWLAGREPQGHRVLRPGPLGAGPAPAPRSRRSARPGARTARPPTTRWCGPCWTPRPRSSRSWPSRTCGTSSWPCARRRRRTSRWCATRSRSWPVKAGGSSSTPSTSSTATPPTRRTRWRCCAPRREAGAEVLALCDTNGGHAAGRDRRRRRRGARRDGGRHRGAAGHPLPQRHRLRGRQLAGRRRRRRARTCRARSTGTASGPATPTCSPSSRNLQLKRGRAGARAGPAARGDPDRARGQRDHERPPLLPAAVCRRKCVRPQGRTARECDQGRPGPVSAHRPDRGRQRHAAAGVGHGRPGLDRAQGPRARLRPRRRSPSCCSGSSTGSRRSSCAATPSTRPTRRSSCCCARRSTEPARTTSTSSRGGSSPTPSRTVRRCPRRRSSCVAGGRRVVATGEGNGPVNALDHALREALAPAYPELAKLELIDFRVRILDAAHGTDAVTRVLIETSDGATSWETVGVAPEHRRGQLGGARRRHHLRPAAAAGPAPLSRRRAPPHCRSSRRRRHRRPAGGPAARPRVGRTRAGRRRTRPCPAAVSIRTGR